MAGHRDLPHTADLRIEAWAPTPEQCITEAVAGLVESFADTAAVRPSRTIRLELTPGPYVEALVTVLDEVIYRLEVDGLLVLSADITRAPDTRLIADLTAGDAAQAIPVGAVPKAVSLHDLRFDRTDDGWSCAVTIDV